MISPLTQQPILDTDLLSVSELADKVIAIEAEIAITEALLKQKQGILRELTFNLLPDAMTALGLSEFKLANGAQITVAPLYACSVSEEDQDKKAKALAWLMEQGLGSLIKHVTVADIGKLPSDSEVLSDLIAFLEAHEIPYADKQQIAAQSLKALMRERVEAGLPFPLDIFRGFVGRVAKVQAPTASK